MNINQITEEISKRGYEVGFNSYTWGNTVNANKRCNFEEPDCDGYSFTYTTKKDPVEAFAKVLDMIKKCEK